MTRTEHRAFATSVLNVPAAVYDQMQADYAARAEGRDAAYAGKAEVENPFPPHEPGHAMWAGSYSRARDEMVAFGLVV